MVDGKGEQIVIGQVLGVRHHTMIELGDIRQTDVIRPEMMIRSLSGSMETACNVLDEQPPRVGWLRHNAYTGILRQGAGSPTLATTGMQPSMSF